MINAEYRELSDEEAAADGLNLSEDDALPWLENDEAEHESGVGVDIAQIVGFIAVLAAVGLGVLGLIWFLTNKTGDAAVMADGSTIEAPEGPYKVRPDDPDASVLPGTGDVAPAVGDGQSPSARLAGNTGAGSGDQDLGIAMPPIAGGDGSVGAGAGAAPAGGAGEPGARARTIEARSPGEAADASAAGSASAGAASTAAAAASGAVGVQLAAYSSEARARQGWDQISRRTSALKGMTPSIEKGTAGIGTVYRLKVPTGSHSEASALCRTLRGQGIDCAVKP